MESGAWMIVIDPNSPIVCCGDVGDDSQAQARAAGVAGTARVEAHEALENSLSVSRGNPGTVVSDDEGGRRSVHAQSQGHRLVSVPARVAHEVAHQPA